MSSGESVLFSLIVPTLNRRGDVERLLASIAAQMCRDFEVIIVDQNSGNLLDTICRDFAGRFPLVHLKTESKGAARARNLGLGSARGTLINFPDDDCEFTPDLLARVASQFRGDPDLDGLFARAIDPISGESSVTRFDTRSQWVTARNLYRTTVEFTMFIRRHLFEEVGMLDETFGPGTYYGAEEGADFVLRSLYRRKRLFYDPSLLIHHAQKVARYDARELERALSYGRGFGRMSAKHFLLYRQPGAALRFVKFQLRAMVAVVLFIARLQPRRSRYYLTLIRGRMSGAWKSWGEFRKARDIAQAHAARQGNAHR